MQTIPGTQLEATPEREGWLDSLRKAWADTHEQRERAEQAELALRHTCRDLRNLRDQHAAMRADLREVLETVRGLLDVDHEVHDTTRIIDGRYGLGVYPFEERYADELGDIRADDARQRAKDMAAESRALERVL